MDERTSSDGHGRSGRPAGPLEFPVASRVNVRMDGTHLLAEPMDEWVRTVVAPLRVLPAPPPGAPETRVRFVRAIDPPGTRVSSIPGGFAEGGVWVADHLGRTAILPLADLHAGVAQADPAIDPSFFVSWVYMPMARAALWRTEAMLVHAAAVELDGRRIAFTGWSGTGKTLVLLEMLRSGANLLADDWLVLAAGGDVGQVTGHLEIMQFHWDKVFTTQWPGRRAWTQRTGTRVAAWGSRRTRKIPFLSRGLARFEESWKPYTVHTTLDAVFPSARQAAPGPLDTLVILSRDPGARGGPADAPEMLAAQTQTFLMGHATLEGAVRFSHPGSLSGSLFPSFREERDVAARALEGARVMSLTFEPTRDDPRRLIDTIMGGSGKKRIGAVGDASD